MAEVAEEALVADAEETVGASVEVEAAGVALAAAAGIVATLANKPTLTHALVTGNAPFSTAATPTLPGETPATSVPNPDLMVSVVAKTAAAEALAEAVEAEEALAAVEVIVTVEAEVAEEASVIVVEALAAAEVATAEAEEASEAVGVADPIAVEALAAVIVAVTTVTGLTKKNWFHSSTIIVITLHLHHVKSLAQFLCHSLRRNSNR